MDLKNEADAVEGGQNLEEFHPESKIHFGM